MIKKDNGFKQPNKKGGTDDFIMPNPQDIQIFRFNPLENKSVLLLGGTGFLGSHIKDYIEQNYPCKLTTFGRGKYDLTSFEQCRAGFIDARPNIVLNISGIQGGIKFNRDYPADILNKNVRMTSNIFDCCKEFKVEKIYSLIPSCAFPDLGELITEDSLFFGPPNESVFSHSSAKRLIQSYCIAYNKQYGLKAVTFGLTNLYGPRDNFHPENAKVVSATIKKIIEAKVEKKDSVEFWGSGAPLRQFLYVKDAARIIISNLDYSNSSKPKNIGSPDEISIQELVDTVVNLVGYEGKILWNGQPDGQMRKMLDFSLPNEVFTSLENGLKETINWYCNKNGIKL